MRGEKVYKINEVIGDLLETQATFGLQETSKMATKFKVLELLGVTDPDHPWKNKKGKDMLTWSIRAMDTDHNEGHYQINSQKGSKSTYEVGTIFWGDIKPDWGTYTENNIEFDKISPQDDPDNPYKNRGGGGGGSSRQAVPAADIDIDEYNKGRQCAGLLATKIGEATFGDKKFHSHWPTECEYVRAVGNCLMSDIGYQKLAAYLAELLGTSDATTAPLEDNDGFGSAMPPSPLDDSGDVSF